ncbi:E3 ubiquitin-protein ligase XIAP isoform X2 [Betta splendens]|uniref:E3 ubiquitin-protein ligase XIAP n=1 Tax=Betta splendens TaxID=158456 RepID=A0A8M1HJ48_BETSP|nr:E3 ubiquitin-protein ligase XIAP isoform X2 [Betta splendens]
MLQHSPHLVSSLRSFQPIMYTCSQDSHLETDHMEADYSAMNSRVNSFRGFSLAQQLPPERLARAGFYYTGHSDCVRCFSCEKTVENWREEDTPVQRHKEVSPTCSFLKCIYPTSCNLGPSTTPINGSAYNEEAEDMEYRLRTGEVVDEATYPLVPHMRSEEARLQTFSSWPSTSPVTPQDLAQAGLFSQGQGDQVRCFCCGGILNGWEEGDTAWTEHSQHFPNCFFVLGHDVGNVPLQVAMEEEGSSGQQGTTRSYMETFEERLASFRGVQHPIGHERLATAGFYSQGLGDKVLCFRCGGGLKAWQPDEDPWEEHAKHYPGCSFLIAEKGQEFVNSIQLQGPGRSRPTASHQNGFSCGNESTVTQMAIEMGLQPDVVEKAILEKTRRTGTGYSSAEELLDDVFKNPLEDEDPLKKLWQLQREKQCKICMDRDFCIVFIPCGHLVTCEECSKTLNKCPICCGHIDQKVKTYIA